MGTTFIKINDYRLLKSAIKKYVPNGQTSLNVYYAASRTRMDVETFVFSTKSARDEMLAKLDGLFL